MSGGPGHPDDRFGGNASSEPSADVRDLADAVDLRPYLNAAAISSWVAVDEIARAVGTKHWALAGGQMVMVHMARHGVTAHRATADADIVVDVRAGRARAMTDISAALRDAGFEPSFSPDGVTKFTKGAARVDLLAPDGLKDPVSTIAGGRAIQAPGATQALRRTEVIDVRWSDRSTVLRCPTLFGALVAKAAALHTHEEPLRRQRHLDDIVVLASIMSKVGPGPDAQPDKKDAKRIRSAASLLAEDSSAWAGTDNRRDVAAILDLLSHPHT